MADEEQAPDPAAIEARLTNALAAFESKAKGLLDELGQKKVELIDGAEGKPSLLDELTTAKEEVKSSVDAIKAFYTTLNSPAEGEEKAPVVFIPEAVRAITEAKVRVDKSEAEIKAYQESLLGKKEGDSDLPGIKQELEKQAKDLSELHSKIFQSSDPNQKPLSDQVGIFLDDFTKKKNELEEISKEIISYQEALLGVAQEDGQWKDGIKDKVAKYVEELGKLLENSTSTQDRLREKSEKMLQAASTASLASASADQKDSFTTMNYVWLGVLGLAILAIMGAPFIDFAKALGHPASSGPQTTEVAWYVHWLMRLPFIAGAVWLGLYASKQRSQNKRLQQEYAYKETVAKIYYVLKQEIEELEKVEESAAFARALKVRVMRILANSVAHNPSITLDSKSHDDKGPMYEGFEKSLDTLKSFAEAVAKWKK